MLRLAVVLAALSAPFARADEIHFVDGRPPLAGVKVTAESLEKVEYKKAGVNQAQFIPADKVKAVNYERPGDDFTQAQKAEEDGDYENAANLYKAAANDDALKNRSALRACAMFGAGVCFRKAGKLDESLKALDELIATIPDSRYVPMALADKGLGYYESGKDEDARRTFAQLKKDATDKKYGEFWSRTADLHLLILQEEKDLKGAFEGYQSLVAATEANYPTISSQAKLRIGRVHVKNRKFDEARAFFQAILDNRQSLPREVVAGAYNGLGNALLGKGQATEKGDAEKGTKGDRAAAEKLYQEALYAFLRVVAQYEDVPQEQPEALYYAGQCFKQVKCDGNTARSQQCLRRVVNEFPGTSWAEKAKSG